MRITSESSVPIKTAANERKKYWRPMILWSVEKTYRRRKLDEAVCVVMDECFGIRTQTRARFERLVPSNSYPPQAAPNITWAKYEQPRSQLYEECGPKPEPFDHQFGGPRRPKLAPKFAMRAERDVFSVPFHGVNWPVLE